MLHADGRRRAERRVTRVEAFALLRAFGRESEAAFMWNFVDCDKADLAAPIIEFRDRREFIAPSADNPPVRLASSSLEDGTARGG